jgi:hypothetical protein
MGQVTGITRDVNIPGEDHTVIIRRLNHVQLKEASKARQSEGVGFMRELGGELLKALRDPSTNAEETQKKLKDIQDKQDSDVSNYDRATLLRYGVVSWTYPIPPISIEKSGVSNGLDELDEPTAKFLASEIFEYSRPQNAVEVKKA